MDDKQLRKAIMDELEFDPRIDAANVAVVVDDGIVTLTGHVASYVEKVAAENAARRVKGVRAIAEELAVRYPGDKKTADDEIAKRAVKSSSGTTSFPGTPFRSPFNVDGSR